MRSFVFVHLQNTAGSSTAEKSGRYRFGIRRAKQDEGCYYKQGSGGRNRKTKMPDLNAADLEAATEMIKGTARSMGIVVED